jgi:hypothetical protein
VTRRDYLQQLLRLYREAPDTPATPRRRDWAIASELYRRGVPLQVVEQAIQLAALRRHLREPELEPLEPIRSLAYVRPLVEELQRAPLDPDYLDYVAQKYRQLTA